jgi:hypothetical protein
MVALEDAPARSTNELITAGSDVLAAGDDTGRPFGIDEAAEDEGKDGGTDDVLTPKTGAEGPNADVAEEVENVPNGDGVPKTFGDAESVEKAEAGFGTVEVVEGPNVEAVGCEPNVDDGHWEASGLKNVCPDDMFSTGSSSTSLPRISSMYSSSVLSSWSSAILSTEETPSIISEILKSPRIVSMSSIASLPNNRSKMHATKYIITTLPCSRKTFASLPKICIPSASTTRSEFLLMGALFRCTCSRKSVVSRNTGWEVICSGISSCRSFWSRI